jgi:6-phosphogluconolactonase
MRISSFVIVACLIAAPLAAGADPANPGAYFMYVGTRSDQPSTSKGIYAWRFDPSKATLTPLGLQARGNNLYHIWPAPNGKTLYGANWQFDENASYSDTLSAFDIDGQTGALRLLNMVDSKGLPTRDAHLRGGVDQVVIDPSGRIAVACNAVGTVVAFPVEADGYLGQAIFVDRHSSDDAVPHPGHAVGPMIHGAIFSPDGKFLYAADLGLDRIYIYRVNSTKRSVQPFSTPFITVEKGAGPRRLQMHPNGKFLYVDHEQAAVVKTFRLDGGLPVEIQSLSTLPPDWTGMKSNSEIQIDHTGRYLYVANRSKNSTIAAYRVDQATGELALIDFAAVDGVPSNITIDPTNHYLFSSNEVSNTVVGLTIDPATGQLSPSGATTQLSSPGAIRFVPAP